MTNLTPTYGNFTLRGEVVWKDRPNAYVENVSENGNTYRKISFGVKTADKNIVEVELFQTKFDEVLLQHKETKKRDKRVKYDDKGKFYDNLPEGYKLFMPNFLGLEQDETGDNIKKTLIPFDAIKYINNKLENGQTIFMFGSPRFSNFKNQDGDIINQVKFEPKGIYLGSIDYGEEGFVSQSTFDQELILTGTEKKDDILNVSANIVIDKDGNFIPYNFFIDITKNKKFAMNINKLKYGTLLKAEGLIHHTVEEQEVENNTDDPWGESPEPKTTTRVKKSLEITKVEKPEKEDMAKYKQEDFVQKPKNEEDNSDNPFAESDNNDGDEWGNSESDPFNDESEEDPFAE